MVFYTGRPRWRAPLRLADLIAGPAELERFNPNWETLLLNLHRTPPETLSELGTAVGHALRVMQAEAAPRERLEHAQSEAPNGLEGLTASSAVNGSA